ncbi:MAG TPA: VWA domain-containing protein [Taishania sp.]|nr:VWA domain-containing protein [Taishania sp.]
MSEFKIGSYEFFAPHWLWLLLLLPVLYWYLLRKDAQKDGEWKFTGSTKQQVVYHSNKIVLIKKLLLGIFVLGLGFLIVAMAKPYNWREYVASNQDYKDGIDIILTIDISGSMLEQDFLPNRIEVAKKVAKEFVDGRRGDRIGLVAYAGEAYTACPATTDYEVLKKQIDALDCYAKIEAGTAIGVGLGTAVTRLRNDTIPSKVIILLTDGSNNAGNISPDEAADLAKAKNVRVYTIGVGDDVGGMTHITTPFGIIQQMMDVDLDEETLKRIADKTDGKYFRAKDEESLRAIYGEIEKMEKRKIADNHFQSEPPAMPEKFLKLALWCILIGLLTNKLLFRENV